MAVNVDTVYQSVLALANKEQRGYITPQEFNLLANQAQRLIFEQYFYDYDQALRRDGNESIISEMVDVMEDKISYFETEISLSNTSLVAPSGFYLPTENVVSNGLGDNPYDTATPHLYKIQVLYSGGKVAEQVSRKKFLDISAGTSALWPSLDFPIYYKASQDVIRVGMPLEGIDSSSYVYEHVSITAFASTPRIAYIRIPDKAEWDYVVVNEKALYNAAGSTNFDLHPSERTNLVVKILELAGVVINKTGLASYATQDQASTAQKQNV
jgi:hypothetical protein